MFKWNFLCFSLCLLPHQAPFTRVLFLSSLVPHQVFIYMHKTSLSTHLSRLNNTSSLSYSLNVRCFKTLMLKFFQYVQYDACTGFHRVEPSTADLSYWCWIEGKVTSLDVLVALFLMQPRRSSVLQVHIAVFWAACCPQELPGPSL